MVEADSDITLTIHGLTAFHGEVDGEVFAEKLSAFVRGLAASDNAANGARCHKFIVADLVKNTATARLEERTVRRLPKVQSSVHYLRAGVDEIRNDTPAARLLPLDFVKQVATLNKGVEERFEFGEIKFGGGHVIRIDKFLAERADRVLEDIKSQAGAGLSFQGVAVASFDGVLKKVDLQADMKRGVLWLTAGGVPIQCNITQLDMEKVRSGLDKRIIASGTAHYDGKSGLPRLFDIVDIEVVNAGQGLERWEGAFHFPEGWDDDLWGEV